MLKFINWNAFKFWKPVGVDRIDDLDKATSMLIDASMRIAPEKRFKAIKLFVETLFKDYRVYKFHGCNRKKKEAEAV